MTKSGQNTKSAKQPLEESDLDAFQPSPPERRIDDKAAQLEEDIQALRVECKRMYFALIFVATTFFAIMITLIGNNAGSAIAIVASLIFLIGMAKWLEFPWVVVNLERWHDLAFKYFEQRATGKQPADTEPLPSENQEDIKTLTSPPPPK